MLRWCTLVRRPLAAPARRTRHRSAALSLALSLSLALGLGLVAAGPAGAAPAADLTGEVVATRARWTSDGGRIVTEVEVRGADGRMHTVSQLGGRVDGLAMRIIPGPPPLVVGDQVALVTRAGRTGAGAAVTVVEAATITIPARTDFVRTGPTTSGRYLRWASGCAQLAVDETGTNQVPGDGEFAAVDAAIATWNDGVAACSYMTIDQVGRTSGEVGRDFTNVLLFRDQTWCRPAVDDDPARCYDSNAAGVTTVTFVDDPDNERDGEIVDADIELNGVNFSLAVAGASSGAAPCRSEIGNTLTHELGHFLGLEHTCLAPGDPARIDDEGAAVPSCAATSDPAIVEATMYNYQDCGEVKKGSLEADDLAAICAVYPLADDPGQCEAVEEPGAGCCSGAGGPLAPLGHALLALAALAPTLRRRRRGRR